MATKSRRAYKGAAVNNALATPINATDVTITVNSNFSGWDTTGTPFFCVLDPGTTKEEKICVVYTGTNTLAVVDPAATSSWTTAGNYTAGRGVDNTTARAHDAGAVIYPVFTAYEANQANELASKYASTGAMVYQDASSFATLALGTSGYPLLAGASAPAYGQVTATGIASDAVTTAKILDLNVTEGKIADSAVTSAKIADGAIVDADINASAAIALSKLATGALPTAITVTSANISDLSIVNADISASAAIVDTKLATIATAGKVSNSATTATNTNTASAIVARDASGNFTAGTVTAALSGNVTGNVTGNASTATALQNARLIGGVSFNGTANINLPGVNASGTQNTTGQAGSVAGLVSGTAVISFTNGSGRMIGAVPHGLGYKPNGAAAYNGDTGAMSGLMQVYICDATYIYVEAVEYKSTYVTITGRTNWMAY